jgi:hypothetical protein
LKCGPPAEPIPADGARIAERKDRGKRSSLA